ncbi:MAG: hypothetical protein P1U61_02235 [Legionellaceae bacterium]|nr:hypothetical protein [Legionellaceae bacterium]
MTSKIQEAAQRAHNYAMSRIRSYDIEDGLSYDEIKKIIEERSNSIRKVAESIRSKASKPSEDTSLTSNEKIARFYASSVLDQEGKKDSNQYNDLVLDYIINNEPDLRAETFHGSDDMDSSAYNDFCVIGRSRDENSNPKHIDTWGDDAYCCTQGEDKVIHSSKFLNGIDKEMQEKILKPDPYLTTDNKDLTDVKKHMDDLIDLYEKKSEHFASVLTKFKQDVEKSEERVAKNKGKRSKEKSDVLKNKIKNIDAAVDKLQQKVPDTQLTREGYVALKSQLEGNLKDAKDVTQFNQDDLGKLDRHRSTAHEIYRNLTLDAASEIEKKTGSNLDGLKDERKAKSGREARAASTIANLALKKEPPEKKAQPPVDVKEPPEKKAQPSVDVKEPPERKAQPSVDVKEPKKENVTPKLGLMPDLAPSTKEKLLADIRNLPDAPSHPVSPGGVNAPKPTDPEPTAPKPMAPKLGM